MQSTVKRRPTRATWRQALFDKLDDDKNGEITHEEAKKFWSKNFAKVNAQAMFNEVDDDGGGTISFPEWIGFWENVIAQPSYDEEEIMEELPIKDLVPSVAFSAGLKLLATGSVDREVRVYALAHEVTPSLKNNSHDVCNPALYKPPPQEGLPAKVQSSAHVAFFAKSLTMVLDAALLKDYAYPYGIKVLA